MKLIKLLKEIRIKGPKMIIQHDWDEWYSIIFPEVENGVIMREGDSFFISETVLDQGQNKDILKKYIPEETEYDYGYTLNINDVIIKKKTILRRNPN